MKGHHYNKRIKALEAKAKELGIPRPKILALHMWHEEWCPQRHGLDRMCICNPPIAIRNGETGEIIVSEMVAPADPAPKGEH